MNPGSCPGQEELSRFCAGNLSEPELQGISQHILTCRACRQIIETLDQSPDPFEKLLRDAAGLGSSPVLNEPQYHTAIDSICQRAFTDSPPAARNESAKPSPCRSDSIVANSSANNSGMEPAESSSVTSPGNTIGQYNLIEEVGRGGMGVVYKAQHTRLNRIVAVKVLPAGLVSDPATVARFDNEILAIGQLNHPNIVRAIDANEINGQHILVIEFVEGRDLASLVKDEGPFSADRACRLIRQAALGLQHIHEAGMVHRDLKPGNLIVSNDGVVRILDLGLALLIESHHQTRADGITATGQVMGTIDYMAPEQADDTHAVDIRADVYSLGATFYYLLTGQAPFAQLSNASVIKKLGVLATKEPTPIHQFRSDVSPSLIRLVERMMAKEPANRFTSAAELIVAIDGLDSKHAQASSQITQTKSDSRTLKLTMLACIAACLVLALLIRGWMKRAEDRIVNQSPVETNTARLKSSRDVVGIEIPPADVELPDQRDTAEHLMTQNARLIIRSIGEGQITTDELCSLLQRTSDNSLRTALINEAAESGLTIDQVMHLLHEANDEAYLAALILTLGSFQPAEFAVQQRQSIEELVVSSFRDEADPEVHTAILWLINHWPQTTATAASDWVTQLTSTVRSMRQRHQLRTIPVDGGWYETPHNTTMVVIPVGASFVAGSPTDESGRVSDDSPHTERQRQVRLPSAFSVSTTEVTEKQFSDAWPIPGRGPHTSTSNRPVMGISWHQAAWYCNRISEMEGIPKSQHCYIPIAGTSDEYGRYSLKEEYQALTGYRLLSEDEWEYCCRAGTQTPRFFGQDSTYAQHYMVMKEAGNSTAIDVGSRKPNSFGLFDMLGNAAEWVNAPAQTTTRPTRRVRGGSVTTGMERMRSALRLRVEEGYPHPSVGMRIARSIVQPEPINSTGVEIEMHTDWWPNDATSDFSPLSDHWQNIAQSQCICLGTGSRRNIPRRWFRVRNTQSEPVRIGPVQLSGNALCFVEPKAILAPGESTRFMIAASGVLFGLRNGSFSVTIESQGQTHTIPVHTTSAVHDARLHVFEGGMSGAPGTARAFDFGNVHRHSDVFHRFTIMNVGNMPLHVNEIKLPDGFHMRHDWRREVPGNSFSYFNVKVDTNAPGQRFGHIRIATNDPVQSDFQFTVSANVVDSLPVTAIGVFRDGKWLFDRNRDGIEERPIHFGQPGDIPLTGDWNGDGIEDLCVCRPSRDEPQTLSWHVHLRGLSDGNSREKTLTFGDASGTPLLLDRRGRPALPGIIHHKRPDKWLLRVDEDRNGIADEDVATLEAPFVGHPIAADLTGTGDDQVGFVLPVTNSRELNRRWISSTGLADDGASEQLYFGEANDIPVTGDWDGDGKDNPGAVRLIDGTRFIWFLDISGGRLPEQEHTFGQSGDIPVTIRTGNSPEEIN